MLIDIHFVRISTFGKYCRPRRARTYLNKRKSSVPTQTRLMQTLYQAHECRIIAQRIAMSAAVIGIYECAIRAQDDPIWFCGPAGWGYALLYRLLKRIREVVPAVAICINRIEASIRSELDPKGGYVSPAGVGAAVDEPGFELLGEVESSCAMLTIGIEGWLSRHLTVLSQH